MAKTSKHWQEITAIEAAKRGYEERPNLSVKYEHGQYALAQAKARSKAEDIKIERLGEPKEVWDIKE